MRRYIYTIIEKDDGSNVWSRVYDIFMFSSLFGVAVIALPSGIITASYLDELHKIKEKEEQSLQKNT
jgi:hypothetical protein